MNDLLCLTGRGSTDERMVRFLSSDTTKMQDDLEFKWNWSELVVAEYCSSGSTSVLLSACMTYCHFNEVWNKPFSWLRISKPGSDFCDTCTTINNSLQACSNDVMREGQLSSLQTHLAHPRSEVQSMNCVRDDCKGPNPSTIHVIIDLAEKVFSAITY